MACPQPSHAQDITTGLVGHWEFEDGTGSSTAADSSGNNNTGTLNAINPATKWVAGNIGSGALDFEDGSSGTDSYVTVANSASLNFTGALSVAFWVKLNSVTGAQDLVQKATLDGSHDWYIQTNGDEIAIDCLNNLSTCTAGTTAMNLAIGTWTHVVVTYDDAANTIAVYKNGVSQAVTATVTGSMPSTAKTVRIGENWTSFNEDLNALMDDVRIYNRALTAGDVSALYAYTGIDCSNPNGVTGEIVFNSTTNQMQYCTSTGWVAMGRSSDVVPACSTNAFLGVSGGIEHSCGIYSDQKLYCWGTGPSGFGSGPAVADATRTYSAIGNGRYWFFALGTDQALYEGYGASMTAVPNGANALGTYTSIDAADSHACGIGTDGNAYCYGEGGSGELGNGGTADQASMVLVSNGDSSGTFTQITTGSLSLDGHTCAIGTDDKAYCWGDNAIYQLGDGTTTDSNTPNLVPNGANPTGTYKMLTAGGEISCGIGMDDKAYCWGRGFEGQMGNGGWANGTTPVLVSNGDNTAGTYKFITSGNITGGGNADHVCGIGMDDKAYCWGDNIYGKLGDGTTTDRNTPKLVSNGANSTGKWRALMGTETHSCGVGFDYKFYCWGYNNAEQLGTNNTTNSSVPVAVIEGTSNGLACVAGTADITTGLVAHMAFDEGSGTSAADSSGSGHTGTLNGGPSWVTGRVGSGALEFTTGEYVRIANPSTIEFGNSDFTVSAWVKRDPAVNTDNVIFVKWDSGFTWGPLGKTFYLAGSGENHKTISDAFGIGGVNGSAIVNDSLWHHLTFTFDNATNLMTHYLDGVSDGSGTVALTADDATDVIDMGLTNGTLTLDDVRIYNRVLTVGEIAVVYVGGITTALGCSSPTGSAGDMVYNSTSSQMQYCNGADWIAMGPAGNGGGGCTNPTGAAGDLVFNSALDVMQYCEGDAWVRIGGAASSGPTNGLVAHWKLSDSAAGPYIDAVGSLDCTVSGSPTSVAGMNGNAINFNTTGYATCGNAAGLEAIITDRTKLTWSAWYKRDAASAPISMGSNPDSGATDQITANFGPDEYVWCTMNGAGGAAFDEGGYDLDLTSDNDGNWHMLTCVYDGSQTGNANRLKMYLDGASVTMSYGGTIPATVPTQTQAWQLGVYSGSDAVGALDDARIYNRALTATEVQQLYYATGGQ